MPSSRYVFDFLRLKPELHVSSGEHAQVGTINRDVMAERPLGDAEAAEKFCRQVVNKAHHSKFRKPGPHVNLERAMITRSDVESAGE